MGVYWQERGGTVWGCIRKNLCPKTSVYLHIGIVAPQDLCCGEFVLVLAGEIAGVYVDRRIRFMTREKLPLRAFMGM